MWLWTEFVTLRNPCVEAQIPKGMVSPHDGIRALLKEPQEAPLSLPPVRTQDKTHSKTQDVTRQQTYQPLDQGHVAPDCEEDLPAVCNPSSRRGRQ